MTDDPRNRPPQAADGGRARSLEGGKRDPHIPPGGLPFGRYTLLRRISYGGMGEIFLAKQAGLGSFKKLLVIKRLLSHYRSDEDIVAMFFDEAKLQSAMTDRHIVQIWDMGEVDKHYFIAMEYVQGQSWRRLLECLKERGEHIHPAHAVDLAVQVCRGMSFAHNLVDGRGRPLDVVHRDLNPQNILLSYDGECKIIDFGIAKSALSAVHTEEGTIKGKFAYMAPEQARAEKVDRRSDVFAFGICLYELLTTKNPFYRKNVVLSLEAICEKQVPPIERVRPAVAALSPVVERCLMKDASDRFADMSEVGEALSGIYKDGLLGEPPVSLPDWLHEVFEVEIEEQARFLIANGFSSITLKRPDSHSNPRLDSPHGVGAEITSRKTRALQAGSTELYDGVPEGGHVETHPTATLAVDLPTHLADPNRATHGGDPLQPQATDPAMAFDISVPWEFSEDTEFPTGDGAVKQAARGFGLLFIALLTAVIGAAAAFYGFLVWELPDKSPAAALAQLDVLLAADDTPGPGDPQVRPLIEPGDVDGAALSDGGQASADGGAQLAQASPTEADAGGELVAVVAPGDSATDGSATDGGAADESATAASATDASATAASATRKQRKGDRRRRDADRKRAADRKAKDPPAEKTAAAPAIAGVLTVNAGGPFRIRGGGVNTKNVARVKVATSKATTITIGGGPMAVKLRVQNKGGQLAVTIGSEPWAIVRVNNVGKGRTPLTLRVKQGGRLKVELKSPKAGEMRLTLGYAAP